jgi:C-terminal processing protease CtpA/Prc
LNSLWSATLAGARCVTAVEIMPLFALLLFLAAPPQDDPAEQLARDLKRMIDVFNIADREAADPISSDQAFYQGAIPGMLKTLDPHSVFFDSGQFEQLKQMQNSESKGFGSIVSVLPGRVIVLQAMEGTPSAKSGLAAGDEILAINGYELARLEFEQLVELLTVARQKEAQLYVRRPGNARLADYVEARAGRHAQHRSRLPADARNRLRAHRQF